MDLPYTATALGFFFLTWIMYTLVARELRKAIGLTSWDDGRKKKIYNRFVLGLTAGESFYPSLPTSDSSAIFPPSLPVS